MTQQSIPLVGPDSAARERRDALLVVAVCTGARCAALRRLADANSGADAEAGLVPGETAGGRRAGSSRSEQLLRDAVRSRPEAVLMSVPCLGACAQASVTAVGPAAGDASRLTWLAEPIALGLTDRPPRARALAEWIAHGAPDRAAMPHPLR